MTLDPLDKKLLSLLQQIVKDNERIVFEIESVRYCSMKSIKKLEVLLINMLCYLKLKSKRDLSFSSHLKTNINTPS
jgi:hypothetical protein